MSNPNALLLLADHIKLSLLERQRAKTLKLARDSQDGHISRSLDQFREGLEALEKAGDDSKSSTLVSLQKQYRDLSSQFHGFPTPASTSSTLTSPNDPSLAADFAHAQSSKPAAAAPHKSVRFSSPTSDLEAQKQPPVPHPLFPYRDDPESAPDPPVDNVQLHAYHQQVLDEQDAQLDVLGASISRQRELSMRIGDELDEQVVMLDESERVTERHQGTLDRARRRVDGFARSAGESRQMVAIVVLIVILVLLIAILK
ncbi:hypothetical protein B0T18DRAFT_331308 [Schizothecium vesticola]|uniref:t-SNARE coiled-coil homology domain-containing protein n=1 Tax=Schizothecium vesticola TaxID=314040 RepID=A0AA40EJC0_9PEZI|nr:hypothetical protein B0T18DRAFT_331308 [Schizothecium vesticola]